jgi:D-psicose/D-tagatose/L-ribulose 3-epimerase
MRIFLTIAIAAVGWQALTAQAPSKVRVGYCTGLKNLEAAKAAGFDYVELSARDLAALPDAEFDAAVAKIKELGVVTPSTNNFIPATIKLTGPQTDLEVQTAYVKKVLGRLSRIGVEIVVFGSGDARRVPEGFSKEQAFQQLVDFGRRTAEVAKQYGITITIEPLRRQETNIINSAAEGLQLVEAINDPGFQLMVDFYHLASEHEDPQIIVRAKEHIRHLHMANPTGRVFPLSGGEFDYAPFFAALRTIGYAARISVEASTKDFDADAPRAIAFLRGTFRP